MEADGNYLPLVIARRHSPPKQSPLGLGDCFAAFSGSPLRAEALRAKGSARAPSARGAMTQVGRYLPRMAEVLTPYATEFRYPGDVLEPGWEEAQEALLLAESFVRFILQRLPEDVRP